MKYSEINLTTTTKNMGNLYTGNYKIPPRDLKRPKGVDSRTTAMGSKTEKC